MNSILRFASVAALAASCNLFAAADDAPAPMAPGTHAAPGTPAPELMHPRKEIRVRHFGGPMETESVTFLGVETAPVSATLVAQLNLPANVGLVVLHVVPSSAAATALKEHDILLKLDDQILIDQHQLAVLVRNHKDGDEVTLTYVRGGQQSTAKVKLSKHDVPKLSSAGPFFKHFAPGPEVKRSTTLHGSDGDRQQVDQVLSLIDADRDGDVQYHFNTNEDGAMRAMRVDRADSNLVYSDDDGSLELAVKNGKKSLVAKSKDGKQEFSGPVNTPEERKAMPGNLRERLEKLESMQNVTFHTDGDFEGAETKVFQPDGKQIIFRHTGERRSASSEAF